MWCTWFVVNVCTCVLRYIWLKRRHFSIMAKLEIAKNNNLHIRIIWYGSFCHLYTLQQCLFLRFDNWHLPFKYMQCKWIFFYHFKFCHSRTSELPNFSKNECHSVKKCKGKKTIWTYRPQWIFLLNRRLQKIEQVELDHCDRSQNNRNKNCNWMALVSYIGNCGNSAKNSIMWPNWVIFYTFMKFD